MSVYLETENCDNTHRNSGKSVVDIMPIFVSFLCSSAFSGISKMSIQWFVYPEILYTQLYKKVEAQLLSPILSLYCDSEHSFSSAGERKRLEEEEDFRYLFKIIITY